nr:tyrosine-protein phosphatase non-receptor type substrate 1-like [Paramormyrops kingsleyae]
MYYCGTRRDYLILFGAGTFLTIKGSGKQHRYSKVEQYPVSDPVQPGDSVTLQCTIETGGCAGEHSVYWFRHGSGESLPGVIYSHGNRSDECEKSPEAGSPTRSCVYSLPKRNLSPSDAGTYYCAVAMCGEMLFGNGTKIHVEKPCNTIPIIMGAALVLCVTVIFTLVCTRNKRTCCEHCAACESEVEHLKDRKETNSQNPDAEMLNYAALHFTQKKGESRRKTRETEDCSLYSDVRLRD